MQTRTGRCRCGAITDRANVGPEFSACHCDMCRRWAGGPLLSVLATDIAWDGAIEPSTIASSAWAERGFCGRCGSGLFYRITAEGEHQGLTVITLESLDDQSGLTPPSSGSSTASPQATRSPAITSAGQAPARSSRSFLVRARCSPMPKRAHVREGRPNSPQGASGANKRPNSPQSEASTDRRPNSPQGASAGRADRAR